VSIQLNIVTCPTNPEKFIRDVVIAPFLLLSVVIVPHPWITGRILSHKLPAIFARAVFCSAILLDIYIDIVLGPTYNVCIYVYVLCVIEDTISSSSHDGVIVDGVNLDEMREFAKQFKIRRLSLGLTQTQVGHALSVTEGPSYSQSAICRLFS